jgi:hypothetical protein
MTTALEGSEGSASRPGRSLPPGKTLYQLYNRLGGPQDRSGQMRKILPTLGFDPRTVQPVASQMFCYTYTKLFLRNRHYTHSRLGTAATFVICQDLFPFNSPCTKHIVNINLKIKCLKSFLFWKGGFELTSLSEKGFRNIIEIFVVKPLEWKVLIDVRWVGGLEDWF